MVKRTRFRSVFFMLGLWVLTGGAVAYFGYHAQHGSRGLEAHRSFDVQIRDLQDELAAVQAERRAFEIRVAQFQPTSVDRDFLDEEARRALGWLHPNDRVLTHD
jgi:cell division protein FtsB